MRSITRARRSAAALVLTSILILTIVWAATRANGREGTQTSTNDGGAWLLNRDRGAIGHLNRAVLEVTAGFQVAEAGSDFDVDQAPGTILVHDRSAARLMLVDDRTNQVRSETTVPHDVAIRAVDSGAIIYRTDPLTVWSLRQSTLMDAGSLAELTPVFEAPGPGIVSVDSTAATIHLIDSAEVWRLPIEPDESLTPEAAHRVRTTPALEPPVEVTALTTVGSTAVLATTTMLFTAPDGDGTANEIGHRQLDTDQKPARFEALQQPGPAAPTVVAVDSDGQLLSVDLDTGAIGIVGELPGAVPLSPIRHDGCIFAVVTAPPTFSKFCDGELRDHMTLEGAGAELRLRLINGWVWINDVDSGGSWITDATTPLQRIDDWGAALADRTDDHSDAVTEDPGGVEEIRLNPENASAEVIDADQKDDDDENDAPVARDDEEQTRVDTPVIVRVLDNDEDADGDILLVDDIELLDASNAQIWTTAARDAVQVSPAAGFTGGITFTYSITDGRGASDRATGTVLVTTRAPTNNRPPVTTTDVATARAGAPVSLNVLLNDDDPDGDALTLVDIAGPDTTEGTLVWDSSGQITFTPSPSATAAQIELRYVVADDFDATATGTARIDIRLAAANSPPDARNDSAVTSTQNPARLNVLRNDRDPDDDALIIARQPFLIRSPGPDAAPDGSGSIPDVGSWHLASDGDFDFLASAAGTYVFDYVISDGQTSDQAQIRIEVLATTSNLPPVAVRDDVIVPRGGSRLVYLLDNDGDPNGDVVDVVEWSGAQGLIVEQVPGLGLRVRANADAPERAVIRYAISDGSNEPVATVIVVRVVDIDPINQPPVVRSDTIELRPGHSTTVAVLSNDYDPEGTALAIMRLGETLAFDADVRIGPRGQTVTITLAPTVTDSFTFGYDVVDADGASSAALVEVRVIGVDEPNRPPNARPDIARTRHGQEIVVSVAANDSDPDGDAVQTESIASQPANGTAELLDDGTVRYTPIDGFTGTDRFGYVLIDALGARSIGQVQIGVTPVAVENRPPSANDDIFTVVAGQAPIRLEVTANDTDPDGDRLQVIDATAPGRGQLRLDGARLIFEAPPPAVARTTGDTGTDAAYDVTFTYRISDGHGNTDDAHVRIRVEPEPVPLPPLANNDQVGPLRANRVVSVDVLANDLDPDGSTKDLTITSDDPALTITNGRVQVMVSGLSSQHRYTITDADGLAASATITISVVDNAAPTLRSAIVETPHGTPITLSLAQQATDPDDDDLFFICCDNTRGGVAEIIRSGNGVLDVTFSPSPGFDGTAGFSYRVDDQAGHLVSGSVAITVLPPQNRPPTANDLRIDIEAGATIPVDLAGLVDDPDASDVMSFDLVRQPRVVRITRNRALVQLTAPIDARPGTDSFSYTVTDQEGATATGSVTVTISAVEAAPPIAVADSASTNQGQPVELEVLINDIDPLGQGLTMFQVGSPDSTATGTTARGSSPGSIVFTPTPDFFGTAIVSYTIRDAASSPEREAVGQVRFEVIGRPGALAAPGAVAGNGSASITWSTPGANGAPIDGYRLEQTSSTGETVLSDLGLQNSAVVGTVINGEEYRFRVQAHNRAGWSEWSAWSLPVRPDTRPGTPAPPVVSFGDGQLVVAWSAPGNQGSPITGYQLEIGGGANEVVALGTVTSQTWRNLANGVEYQFRVAATNAAGDSDWSNWSTSEHPLGPPSAVGAPTVNRGNRSLDVRWNRPADNGDPITSFEIELRSSGQVVAVTGAGATSYQWADLTNGIAQEFRLRAGNRATQPGPWGAWSTPVTPCSVPDPPVAPAAARGDRLATVGWVAPEDQGCAILSYNIRANGSTVQTIGAGASSHIFTGLSNGSTYSFEVQAINEEGAGPWSAPSAPVVPAGPPTAPTIGAATATGLGQITVTFGGAAANGTPLTGHELSINGGNPVGHATTTFVATGLGANTNYSFRVRSCNAVACGPWSGSSTATTWGPPSSPAAVSATAGNSWWRMTWSSPPTTGGAPVTDYQYRVDGGTIISLGPSTFQLDLAGRPNNVSISGDVRACSAVGCGPWAGAVATPTAPPPTVTISVGNSYSGAGCVGTCSYVRVTARNLTPGVPVSITCHSSLAGQFLSTTRTTAADGSLDQSPCFYGYPGETVWVVVAGTTSNALTWL